MYRSSIVCFCDIPLVSLALHRDKHSRFGLSFTKRTMPQKGANPVFYVAKDSIVSERLPSVRDADWQSKPLKDYSRRQYLDRLMSVLDARRSFPSSDEAAPPQTIAHTGPSDIDFHLLFKLESLLRSVDIHLVSSCVLFSGDSRDAHPDNYYFEREWRALGNVTFYLTGSTAS